MIARFFMFVLGFSGILGAWFYMLSNNAKNTVKRFIGKFAAVYLLALTVILFAIFFLNNISGV